MLGMVRIKGNHYQTIPTGGSVKRFRRTIYSGGAALLVATALSSGGSAAATTRGSERDSSPMPKVAGRAKVRQAGTFGLPIAGAWQNMVTGACLDDSPLGLRGMPCGYDNPWQHWSYTRNVDGFSIRNSSTGNCLDDSPYGLRMMPCGFSNEWSGLEWQRWYFLQWPHGAYNLKNASTGACLDDSHQYGVRAFPCNNTDFQGWWNLQNT
jgi:hypothetical protein